MLLLSRGNKAMTVIIATLIGMTKGQNFGYREDDEYGPARWSAFGDGNTCDGSQQSPIAITKTDIRFSAMPHIDFTEFRTLIPGQNMILQNNGHTLAVKVVGHPGPQVVLDATRWHLVEIQFQWGLAMDEGSEHTVWGRRYVSIIVLLFDRYPLEMHLICEADASAGYVIFAVLFDLNDEGNSQLEAILERYQQIERAGSEVRVGTDVSVHDLLPTETNPYFRYEGSLTSPPCTEKVRWYVLEHTSRVSPSQLQKFRSLLRSRSAYGEEKETLAPNYRPLQPIGNRVIEYSGEQPSTRTNARLNHILDSVNTRNYSKAHAAGVLRLATSLLQRAVGYPMLNQDSHSIDSPDRVNLKRLADQLSIESAREERIDGQELGETARRMKFTLETVRNMMKKRFITREELKYMISEIQRANELSNKTFEVLKRAKERKKYRDEQLALQRKIYGQIAAAEAFREGMSAFNQTGIISGSTDPENNTMLQIGRADIANLTAKFSSMGNDSDSVQYHVVGGTDFVPILLSPGQKPCPTLRCRQPSKTIPDMPKVDPVPLRTEFSRISKPAPVVKTPAVIAKLPNTVNVGIKAEPSTEQPKEPTTEPTESGPPDFAGLLDVKVSPVGPFAAMLRRRGQSIFPGLAKRIGPAPFYRHNYRATFRGQNET